KPHRPLLDPCQIGIPQGEPTREGTCGGTEREPRSLRPGPPPASAVTASRRITDRYLPGTRLRVRRGECLDSGACELKLTQKVPARGPRHVQGLITNTHPSAAEYDLLAPLPGAGLSKTRRRAPPLRAWAPPPRPCPAWSWPRSSSPRTRQWSPSSRPGPRSPRSPTTPGSPEAVLPRLAVVTCSPGSPSTASSSRRASDPNPSH